ncbi:hypothetical protein ACQP2K_16680 [Microbispora siamensis]
MPVLRRCPSCGGWEYGGAPECPRCAELVVAIVEECWRDFLLREFGDRVASADERAVAEMVADEPDRQRLLLPALLTGFLPTREQAQRLGALVKRGARAEDLAVAIDELAAATG